jgi:phosphoribosyl-ATP pyrophosphohydrolase
MAEQQGAPGSIDGGSIDGGPIDGSLLDELFTTIEGRRGGDPAVSHTARLLAAGTPKIAQKLGEEAVETVIEALRGDATRLTAESADLLYHLLVLWSDRGVAPEAVWRELARRRGTSGLAEKAARGKAG